MRFDGIDVHANLGGFRSVLGYVPQDDIIHADLPLVRTLRLLGATAPSCGTSAADVDEAVRDALVAVGLTEQAEVRVGSLSGGQRKRASIAVELLTDPHVFFLDEPTSGLDPLTSAELITRLRQLADRSATVVFTTHSIDDLALCDRIVFMTRGGSVGFVGTIDEALEHFAVGSVAELYRCLTDRVGLPTRNARLRIATGTVRLASSAAAAACHPRRPPTRDRPAGGERAHAMACPDAAHARDPRSQPLDARHPARVTGARRRHVRRSSSGPARSTSTTRARAPW